MLPALHRKAHSLGTEDNSHMDRGGKASRSAKLETFKFFIYSLVCSLVNSLFWQLHYLLITLSSFAHFLCVIKSPPKNGIWRPEPLDSWLTIKASRLPWKGFSVALLGLYLQEPFWALVWWSLAFLSCTLPFALQDWAIRPISFSLVRADLSSAYKSLSSPARSRYQMCLNLCTTHFLKKF